MFLFRRTGVFFILLVLLVGSLLANPALAQDCNAVVIDDSTSQTKLDRSQICQAAQSWTGSFRVYVYLTDARPANESEWFNMLDQFEVGQGIRNSVGFHSSAIVFAATTATPNTFGATIEVGEALASTRLWDDAVLAQLKGQFRNSLESKSATNAFVDVINAVYVTAFPPQPTPQPTPLPVSTQVVIQQVQNVQVDTKPLVEGAGVLLLIVVLVGGTSVGGYFSYTQLISPRAKRMSQDRKYREQALLLQSRTSTLLLQLETLLVNGNNSTLYQLWVRFGCTKYPETDSQIKNALSAATQARDTAQETFTLLAQNTSMSPEEAAQNWEHLYLTIVGTTPEILSMTKAELENFLNPLLTVKREEVPDELVQQVTELFEKVQGDESVRVGLLIVDPATVNSQGILGYVDGVKRELDRLQQAKEAAAPCLAEAKALLEQVVAQTQFDAKKLTQEDALVFPRQKIAQAENALNQELWVNAQEAALAAVQVLEELPSLIKAFYEVNNLVVSTFTEYEVISANGYNLSSVQKQRDQVLANIKTFKTAVAEGKVETALEFISEIEKSAGYALAQARSLPELQAKNNQELVRLSKEVARIQAHLTSKVAPLWAELQGYPRSNWSDIADNMATAQQILASLFDDPANASDIASTISRFNHMEIQDFKQAEQLLVDAFASAQKAENLLSEIEHQHVLVKKTEREVRDSLDAASADFVKTVLYRDTHNVKLDFDVDNSLSQAELTIKTAKGHIVEREFMLALQLLVKARQLIVSADQSANEQIQALNTALSNLESAGSQAFTVYRQAQTEHEQLPAPARLATIATSLQQALAKFEAAKQAEQAASGKQGREWLKALQNAQKVYGQAEQSAEATLAMVRAEKERYQKAVDAARSAISDAETEIASARNLVSNSDAGGSGRGALSRAESMVLRLPSFGSSYDAFKRVEQTAIEAKDATEQAASEARFAISARQAVRRREDEARRQRELEEADRRRSVNVSLVSPSVGINLNSTPRAGGLATSTRPSSGPVSSSRPSTGPATGLGSSNRSSSFGESKRSSSFGKSKR